MQSAAIAAAGLDITYDAVDVPAGLFNTVLREMFAEGAAGNVTIPHKRAAHDECDALTATATRAGAVNTFFREGDLLIGHNTDVDGFDSSARALLGDRVENARVVLLGAGGGAAAVLTAVERWAGARATVLARSYGRADVIATRFGVTARDESELPRTLAEATVVVNATPVGMNDDLHPADLSLLARDAAVIDLVYRPGGTAWVRAAGRSGRMASDGLPILVEQGALAFRSWFGVEPDREAMRRAVG